VEDKLLDDMGPLHIKKDIHAKLKEIMEIIFAQPALMMA